MRKVATTSIWNFQSSWTNLVLHVLGEVGAEVKVFILGQLILYPLGNSSISILKMTQNNVLELTKKNSYLSAGICITVHILCTRAWTR